MYLYIYICIYIPASADVVSGVVALVAGAAGLGEAGGVDSVRLLVGRVDHTVAGEVALAIAAHNQSSELHIPFIFQCAAHIGFVLVHKDYSEWKVDTYLPPEM